MLIVKPIQEKSEQESYSAACKTEYEPDALCYGAWVDDALVGICQFRLGAGCAVMTDLCRAEGTDDIDALFIMGRQTMNFIDLHGVHECRLGERVREQLTLDFIKKLGFSEKDGELWCDLNGFFDSPCEHGKAGSPR